MQISGRAARRMLGQVGVTDRYARAALAGGLAGPPERSSARDLYQAAHVAALVDRPVLGAAEMAAVCPRGFCVTRSQDLPAGGTRTDLLGAAAQVWVQTSVMTRMLVTLALLAGPLPFVVTVAGFVVAGADLSAIAPGGRLVLHEPGGWFASVRQARVPTPPGRPWFFHLPAARVGDESE